MTGTRLSISFAGGASLGAYHAGVMAALLVAVETLRDEDPDSITLEAAGGASAGALVSLIGSIAHLRGLDPVAVLREAWVERVDFDLLTRGPADAPLSPQGLRRELGDVFAFEKVRATPSPTQPIVLNISLTGLRGLTYRTDGVRGERSITSATYADWYEAILDTDVEPADVFEPSGASIVEAALASAAHPGAFPAQLLDRSAVARRYRERGIEDLPDPAQLWYTDGTLIQVSPLGRILAAGRRFHGSADGKRLAVLVHPRSEGPTTGGEFADRENRPRWLPSLARSLDIITAQHLYDDVRRISQINTRLDQLDELAERLDENIGGEDVRRALREIAGLEGKERVAVDVLSPALLLEEAKSGADLTDMLAGEILGDLGGFLDRSLRASDFTLGYATVHRWLEPALSGLGHSRTEIQLARKAIEAAHTTDWKESAAGRVDVSDLPVRSKAQLLRLSGRALRAAARTIGGRLVRRRRGT